MFLEQEPGPAMVLRVEQMLLTCCSSVSFVSKGKFNSFCLWFADKFDTDTEDWKPNFESGSTTRCSRCKAFHFLFPLMTLSCALSQMKGAKQFVFIFVFPGVVPEGTYELCSRTQRYPVTPGKSPCNWEAEPWEDWAWIWLEAPLLVFALCRLVHDASSTKHY